jgi:hypothetical protein
MAVVGEVRRQRAMRGLERVLVLALHELQLLIQPVVRRGLELKRVGRRQGLTGNARFPQAVERRWAKAQRFKQRCLELAPQLLSACRSICNFVRKPTAEML